MRFLLIRVIAVVCAGLLAGIYLADRASAPARMSLSAANFVQFQQTVHAYYVVMMPPLVIVALLAVLLWLFIVRLRRRAMEFWLIAASAVGIILVAVLTRAVNVPLNNQLMTWSYVSPPANLRELWAPWERVDTIRTFIMGSVFILEAVALSLRGSSNSPG